MKYVRVLGIVGLLSIITTWTAILVAIALSRCFDLYSMALSDLGDWITACNGDPVCLVNCNRLSEPVFNYGLIIGGLMLAISTISLYKFSRSYSILLTMAGISLALVGFLPERYGVYHFMAALVFFLLLPIAMVVYSKLNWRSIHGKLAIVLALISVMGIVLFIAIRMKIVNLGYAIPEIIGALPASIWISMLYVGVLRKGKPT